MHYDNRTVDGKQTYDFLLECKDVVVEELVEFLVGVINAN